VLFQVFPNVQLQARGAGVAECHSGLVN